MPQFKTMITVSAFAFIAKGMTLELLQRSKGTEVRQQAFMTNGQ
jgi:hypothetical protein